jgi:hypothetical protein
MSFRHINDSQDLRQLKINIDTIVSQRQSLRVSKGH